MTHENVKEPRIEEEPRQCTMKEKLGHAIGVLGNRWLHYHRIQYHHWDYLIVNANGTSSLW